MGLSLRLSLQHSLVQGRGEVTSFHLLLIPRLHMPAEKRSFLLYPCSQLKPICLDLCLDSEGTLSIGEGGAQRRHEGTRWSSASKGHWPSLI